MFREAARFGDGFELPVDIFRITLFSNTNAAYGYHVMLRINSVNARGCRTDTFNSPPEARATGARIFGVDGELLLQDFCAVDRARCRRELSSPLRHLAWIEIRREVWIAPLRKLARRAKVVFALCSFAKDICSGRRPASGNLPVDGPGQTQQAIGEFAVRDNLQSGEN